MNDGSVHTISIIIIHITHVHNSINVAHCMYAARYGTVQYVHCVLYVQYVHYVKYVQYVHMYLVPSTWYLVCIHVHPYASVCTHMHPSRTRMHHMPPYASITHPNANIQHTCFRKSRNIVKIAKL